EKIKIREEASEEVEERIKQLLEENERRKNENKALKQREIDLLKKEQDLKEKQEEIELEMQKKLLEKQEEIADEVRKKEQEKTELKLKEYEKKLEDQKKLVEEMQRKAEQGSMQMQGEVQELALEEILKSEFPFDSIEPVEKGIKGADVIQVVKNEFQQICGRIIYESKRTKSFSEGWIEKLKKDQRSIGAEISVIVSESLPKDMVKFGRKDGVWICTFPESKHVAFVLREMLLREYMVRSSVSNVGGKMESLYDYLTSEDFRQKVEGIVEGFSSLKNQIDNEKRAMQRIWKEREKQLEKVIENTIGMYGSIRGIAGSAIGSVPKLELACGEMDEDQIS
ncbi:MAG: DUF2130 domain-containing protein, partial [Clostridia bacterium]|nr:DUF2130 domain-containing protein [Clostridia bacterium]